MFIRNLLYLPAFLLLTTHADSQDISGSCSSKVLIKGNYGQYQSTGYPKIKEKHKCTWIIQVDKGEKIKLFFEDFDLKAPSYCGGDKCECSHVILRDDANFWKFCNEKLPPSTGIVSSGNELRVQIRKVQGLESRGIKVRYSTSMANETVIIMPPPTVPDIPPSPQGTQDTATVVIPPGIGTSPVVNIYTEYAQDVDHVPVLAKKSSKKAEKEKYKYVVLAPAIPAVLFFIGGVIGIAIYQQRKEDEGDEELERLAPKRRSRVARIKEFFHKADDEKDSGRDALYDEMLKNWRTNQQDGKQTIWDDYINARRRSNIRKEIQQYVDQTRVEGAPNGNVPAENAPNPSLLSPDENKKAKRVSWHDEAVSEQPVVLVPPTHGHKPKSEPIDKDKDTGDLPFIMVRQASEDVDEGIESDKLITPERSPIEESPVIPVIFHQPEGAPPGALDDIPLDEFPSDDTSPQSSEPLSPSTEEDFYNDPQGPIDWDAPAQETSLLTEAPYSCSDHVKDIIGDSDDEVPKDDEEDWLRGKIKDEDEWNPWEYRTPSRRQRQTSTDTSDVEDE